MSTESHENAGGFEGGHEAPLRNDLPRKPEPWSPQYTPFQNTYVQDHIDWTVTKRERLRQPSAKDQEVAEALAARVRAETAARRQRS